MANLIALPSGTELVGDFRIERVLGAGGFGVTYLAQELALARPVTIKEYFPADFAARSDGIDAAPRSQECSGDYKWGLDRFIEEAQTLARFDHPNIVRVYRYFRANNTGYMVLHFEEGQSLKAWLKGLARAPRQKELDSIIAPLLDALEVIHKADFLHRDIAPDNIIIRNNGQPVLIDFGSARGEIAAHSKTISALVKPGYSPYEQYAETSSRQGPWTDIYALGATLYHAISGRRPPDAPSRMVKDEIVPAREAALSSYRPGFLTAIDKALALTIEARPQAIAAWRGDLLAPEPAKANWLARAIDSTRGKSAAGEFDPVAPAQEARTPSVAMPPQPDAPGPKGGLIDFLEGLKNRGQAARATASQLPAEGDAQLSAETIASNPPPIEVPARIMQSKADKARAVKAEKAERARIAKAERAAAVAKAKSAKSKPDKDKGSAPPPPRPRPGKWGEQKTWAPLAIKLLIGAGVASAFVALQDRLPRFESRGTAVTTSQQSRPPPAPRPPPVAMLAKLEGHQGAVTAVAYNEDGSLIVSAGQDGTIKVWDALAGTLARTIEMDDGPPSALAISGRRAITGHGNGGVVVWDLDRAEKLASFKRNEANIWSVAFAGSPDRVAASSHDWTVTLWNAAGGPTAGTTAPLHVFEGHENAVQSIAYGATPAGPVLISGGADRTVKMWNLDNYDLVRTYRGHKDFVTGLAFSPTGKILAASSLDGSIRVWSSSGPALRRTLYGHKGRVGALAFSPDGELLASASDDGQVRIWDLRRSRTARTLTGHSGAVKSVAFAPDGTRLVSAGNDGVVRVWSIERARVAGG